MLTKKIAAGLISAALMAGLTIPATAQSSLDQLMARAQRRHMIAPLEAPMSRNIVIDGDLSDWGQTDNYESYIVEALDGASGLEKPEGRDAATFRLMRGEDALYVAVRVVDASIATRTPIYNGDSVQLYFDFRSPEAASSPLGTHAFSPGVFQLAISAPTAPTTSLHYEQTGAAQTRPIGPIDVAGKPLPDGYSIEARIPYSSLGISPARLNFPIGFDIAVGDIDVKPDHTVTDRAEYAWSGSDETWRDASLMGLAVPNYARPKEQFARIAPLRLENGPGYRNVVAGLVTPILFGPSMSRIDLSCKATSGKSDPVPAHPVTTTIEFPSLGIRATRCSLEFQSLQYSRYTVTASYPAFQMPPSKLTFEALSWRKAPAPGHHDVPAVVADMPTAGNGSVLPNGWTIRPVGRALKLVGDMPSRLLFGPGGRYLYTSTAGYNAHGVTVIDPATWTVVSQVEVPHAWTGMAIDAKHSMLYLSAGFVRADSAKQLKSIVYRYAIHGPKLERLEPISIPALGHDTVFIAGLATDDDGNLAVVDTVNDRVLRIDTNQGIPMAESKVGYHPNGIAYSPITREFAVSNWGDKSVSLIDVGMGPELARIPVDSHPVDLAFGPHGRLYVVNAGANSISIVKGRQVVETVKTSIDPRAPIGSTPDAIAIAPKGDRIYVANADNNDVAVINVAHPGQARVAGFIPAGWYPSAITVSPNGKKVYIGTGKGLTFSPNPHGAYIGTLLQGHVSEVAAPTDLALAALTRRVIACTPLEARQPRPAIMHVAGEEAFKKIKHVLYIIRENRTYDQVFGDITAGNGDPSLTMFGREVTPNAHHLAARYVLMDNLYCNGEVSEDGHMWCDSAYTTDFIEKSYVNSYSDRPEPDADERLIDSPAGYLWDNCARHRLSFYSYGEYTGFKATKDSPPVYNGQMGLKGHASYDWTRISFDRHDTQRVEIFKKDLEKAEKTGKWWQFMVMSLGEDHTQGAEAGKYTPVAHVAANDQALGQIVEAISHSRFWKETAIFVIEDDAQNGQDHVDAHRTAGLVISPYVRRGQVDSTFYTTSSFVRTIELILGLPPMTQFDASATPLTNAFTPDASMVAYENLSPIVDLEARNPSGTEEAALSAKLDFSAYDHADPEVLNRILWRTLKPGIPQPPAVHSPLIAMALRR